MSNKVSIHKLASYCTFMHHRYWAKELLRFGSEDRVAQFKQMAIKLVSDGITKSRGDLKDSNPPHHKYCTSSALAAC